MTEGLRLSFFSHRASSPRRRLQTYVLCVCASSSSTRTPNQTLGRARRTRSFAAPARMRAPTLTSAGRTNVRRRRPGGVGTGRYVLSSRCRPARGNHVDTGRECPHWEALGIPWTVALEVALGQTRRRTRRRTWRRTCFGHDSDGRSSSWSSSETWTACVGPCRRCSPRGSRGMSHRCASSAKNWGARMTRPWLHAARTGLSSTSQMLGGTPVHMKPREHLTYCPDGRRRAVARADHVHEVTPHLVERNERGRRPPRARTRPCRRSRTQSGPRGACRGPAGIVTNGQCTKYVVDPTVTSKDS